MAGGYTIADVWEGTVDQWEGKEALVFHEERYSFTMLDRAANRLANWAVRHLGLTQGQVVALSMRNRPAFVICWLAMAKLGVGIACINTNLTGEVLRHSLSLSKAQAVFFDSDTAEAILAVSDALPGLTLAQFGDAAIAASGVRPGAAPTIGKEGAASGAGLSGKYGTSGAGSFGADAKSGGASFGADSKPAAGSFGRGGSFGPGSTSGPSPSPPSSAGGVVVDLESALASSSPLRPSRAVRASTTMRDVFALVYTSGTTGLPKAAVITHARMFVAACMFGRVFGVGPSDRVYTVLPLYHSAGGMIGLGMMLYQGCTMVLRERFSASQFWDDCVRHRVSVIQYIGELCRYLVSSPPHPLERRHRVRLAVGNGMRPDVWPRFVRRFGIPAVGEFYAATEGNAALFNLSTDEESMGAVGKMGLCARALGYFPIVRYDEDAEAPARGPDGLCEEVADGEVGELLGVINEGDPTREFRGYFGNKKATDSKVARSVKVHGDKYFRTGDLLMRKGSLYYFKERIGETYRWKGENCSVSQLEAAFNKQLADAMRGPKWKELAGYGVEIQNYDGKAGMVALVLEDEPDDPTASTSTSSSSSSSSSLHERVKRVDFGAIARHIRTALPSYAVPLFLRFRTALDKTTTFKIKKADLRKEGADPAKTDDPIYVLATGDKYGPQARAKPKDGPDSATYIPLTKPMYDHILEAQDPSRRVRLAPRPKL